MKKITEFAMKTLPAAYYHAKENAIIYGLASEGSQFVYSLLEYFFEKEQTEFLYKKEDILFYYDCDTYDEMKIIKIELKSSEQVKKVYLLFSLDEDKEIHNKSYYVTVETDGQVYCAAIDEEGRCDVCLEAVTSEAEEVKSIVEDYFDYWT